MNKSFWVGLIGGSIVSVIFWFGIVKIVEVIIDRAEASHPLECRELDVIGAECSAAVQE